MWPEPTNIVGGVPDAPPTPTMRPLVLSRYTLVSALGRGLEATYQALLARRSGLRLCDFEDVALKTYIGRVDGLEDLPVGRDEISRGLERFDCRNNRLALVGLRQDGFLQAAIDARDRYGRERIGVFLGTSTSGILETEHAYQQRDAGTGDLPPSYIARYRYTHNIFSSALFVRTCLGLKGPAMVVSTACSSSAKVFATAARFIEAGLCDAAIVGGVDSLCLTVLYGFTSLQLTSGTPCRPSDEHRDGLSLGEAAGFALLEKSSGRDPAPGAPGAIGLLGYGESCDGYHMSHPHPEGAGAVRAMQEALSRSGLKPSEIDYINLHGTASQANDSIEDRAVSTLFETSVPCSSTKGWTGHTLGAAGITEAVIAALCVTRGLVPGTLNSTRVDPTLKSHIVLDNQIRPVRRVLSNIFGFGGNNCSLILGGL